MNGGLSASARNDKGDAPSAATRDSFNPEQEMDLLLDKIARGGIASLSPDERDRLEKARRAMIRREEGR